MFIELTRERSYNHNTHLLSFPPIIKWRWSFFRFPSIERGQATTKFSRKRHIRLQLLLSWRSWIVSINYCSVKVFFIIHISYWIIFCNNLYNVHILNMNIRNFIISEVQQKFSVFIALGLLMKCESSRILVPLLHHKNDNN